MDAAQLTLPEFLAAVESISQVREELRPKSLEELVSSMAQSVSQQQQRNRAHKARKDR